VGLADFFRRLLDSTRLPVVLYHIPAVTGVPICDRLLGTLGDHERLVGVKDSTGDRSEMERLLARFSEGRYWVGNDHLVAACRTAGGWGNISAAVSVAPTLAVSVSRDPSRQHELDAVRDLLEEFGLGSAVKAILRAKGFGVYASRPPMVALDGRRERDVVERFEGLMSRIEGRSRPSR
jgi:4-hydroxy-tetrahydrodipicolinate synthase